MVQRFSQSKIFYVSYYFNKFKWLEDKTLVQSLDPSIIGVEDSYFLKMNFNQFYNFLDSRGARGASFS